MKLVFLGSGGSKGVPMVGCECRICSSSSVFNKRLRSSALLEIEGKRFLIDSGPDFRFQALKYGVKNIAGFLLTHAHFDHIAGIDDLATLAYHAKSSINCLASNETLLDLKKSHNYLFRFEGIDPFRFHILKKDFGEVQFCGIKIHYIHYMQSNTKVTGFRFGDLAYMTDISSYCCGIFPPLMGIKILIISLRAFKGSKGHLGLKDILNISNKVGAQKTYLTHLSHDIDYERDRSALPKGFNFAYDGLEVQV